MGKHTAQHLAHGKCSRVLRRTGTSSSLQIACSASLTGQFLGAYDVPSRSTMIQEKEPSMASGTRLHSPTQQQTKPPACLAPASHSLPLDLMRPLSLHLNTAFSRMISWSSLCNFHLFFPSVEDIYTRHSFPSCLYHH